MCSITIDVQYYVYSSAIHLYNYIVKVHFSSKQPGYLYILCLYPTRINQNPDKATSVKLQQSGTKVAASDVLHGEAHGITQHSLASSSSPAVSQAYNEQADVYVWSVMMVYLFRNT